MSALEAKQVSVYDLPVKHCDCCGSRLRRGFNSLSYDVGICSKCIQNDPQYVDLKREINNFKQRKFQHKKRTKK